MNNNLYWDSNNANNIATPEVIDPTAANSDQVLFNVGFRDPVTREFKVGKMPINNDLHITMSVGDRYNIPKGYHSGKTIIDVLGLKESTLGTATEDDIVANKIAWVNGIRVIGKLDKNQNSMIGTASEEDLLDNKTAWVDGRLLVGKIPIIMRQDYSLLSGEVMTIPRGYHGGEEIITVKSLESQTVGTATPTDIAHGKIAWSNGIVLVGEALTLNQMISDATAFSEDIREGLSAYTSVGKVFGSMIDYLKQPTRTLMCGSSFKIPKGYHDGLWTIQAASLKSQTGASATKDDIRKGKNAWVDGILVEGEMIQNYAPNTDGTAIPNDIANGKVAWVNGEAVIGSSPYDTIDFTARIKNDTYPTSPVIITMPDHNWDLIRNIIVEVYSTTDNHEMYDFQYREVKSEDIIMEKINNNDAFSIVTSLGSPKIFVTSFIPNTYLKVFVSGYTLLR